MVIKIILPIMVKMFFHGNQDNPSIIVKMLFHGNQGNPLIMVKDLVIMHSFEL